MKIVVIGAGSQIFGLRAIVDILREPIFQTMDTELALVDTSDEKLQTMFQIATMAKARLNSTVVLKAATDRTLVLSGADYVFISVSNRRYELWEQDFRVPYLYGFKQAYAENGGPGAMFHSLRNIHIIMGICADIERLCPEAYVFNFSNPESRVLLAIKTLTPLRAVGLCHGQNDALNAISRILGRPMDTISIRGGGINHLFWLQQVCDRQTGENLYPLLKERAKEDQTPLFTLPKKLLEIYGMLTYPDNTHAGEFLACGSEYMGGKWVHGLENRKISTLHKSKIDLLQSYLHGKKPLDEILVKSREIAIPIIAAIIKDQPVEFDSGNTINDHLYIPNLMAEGVVEVPIRVDGRGIHPQSIPALPEGVAAFCRTQMSIQILTVQAYKERSKNLLLQTLMLEPTVNSIVKAEALIEDMLQLQQEYLPVFK